ncbi:MAG: hypothetical protein MRZ48_03435 [Anaerostipes hadrus]|nr:hypothetical protein [Anaerostipes hadrus]
MRNFEIIGGSDSEKIDRVKKLITLHDCWQRQYHDAIYKAMSENKGKEIADYPQEDLMKIVLSGIKYINLVREIRRENERVGTDYRQSLEESQATFNLIDAIFTIMGYIKLKNLVITFPVTKDFDGDKWGCKDYFYTMDVLSEMDWDKPIGRDKISDLLWDYQNNDLRSAYVEYMCVTSALYRAQTGKGIAEQWVEDMGIPTYDVDEDSGFIMDNQTGKVSKLEKSSHIQIVK